MMCDNRTLCHIQKEYYDVIAQCDSNGKSTDFIVFMLRCLKEVINGEVTNKVANKVTNKSEDAILKLLGKSATLMISDIQKKTGLSESGVKKILKSLKDKNLLVRVGSNKNGFWKVN